MTWAGRSRSLALRLGMTSSLGISQHQPNRRRESLPLRRLRLERRAAGLRQLVELRVSPRIRLTPLRRDEPLLLEAMQRRIQRTLRDLQDILRHLLDALRDRPAMLRLGGQGLENQEVQCPLDEVGRLAHDYGSIPRSSTTIPRRSTIGNTRLPGDGVIHVARPSLFARRRVFSDALSKWWSPSRARWSGNNAG